MAAQPVTGGSQNKQTTNHCCIALAGLVRILRPVHENRRCPLTHLKSCTHTVSPLPIDISCPSACSPQLCPNGQQQITQNTSRQFMSGHVTQNGTQNTSHKTRRSGHVTQSMLHKMHSQDLLNEIDDPQEMTSDQVEVGASSPGGGMRASCLCVQRSSSSTN